MKFYHGTTKRNAEEILRTKRFRSSCNPYDWLGPGVYFYQDAPIKALIWASKFACSGKAQEDTPAVLEVSLDLNSCFDLLSQVNLRQLAIEKERLDQDELGQARYSQKRPVLRDNSGKRHMIFASGEVEVDQNVMWGNNILDRAVVLKTMLGLEEKGLGPFKTVRQIFWEGQEIYRKSFFYDHSNIQVCISGPDMSNSQKSAYIRFDDEVFIDTPKLFDFGKEEDYILSNYCRWPI